ncbi:2-aminoethylphosphonate--pyruvate transaminase [Vibrio sp. 10N.286.49.C2]|uniref:2-aminoethylphosphonate--pyruvate transaminase n=1 Tax=unclassified Vibrio TaxID=2614977 RepID=UPI000C85FF3C|nr:MULTISPECIES: 2-aminoethylphosphonate--pyruvate transaminase [unclassified Vibrio]PMH43381.1 2-aminoethylphosphonate--pyruvate transaminase [Vibrio sp. 10N.286.49.C2]PMH57033.1 2-aminoethylphosphonate--pyruvate transaminase [Vibrio sp. 10N.286.49.B1]PMH83015.1 2-aminoethylphosphonate--pyruvate transaminase [Vibrio sp. 10N.286.48.B7]
MKNEYLLLTPGPLSTSETVRQAMLKDWCTWDDDYNKDIVEVIRTTLTALATSSAGYTSVLMQGSGTASVEATIGSALGKNAKLLVVDNGAYGARMAQIAEYLSIPVSVIAPGEVHQPSIETIQQALVDDSSITHVAIVHCETTTGMLNPIDAVVRLAKQHDKIVILDAMSSFGGIPMDIAQLGVDFMISSANKCIQGVPGFGFVIAKQSELEKCQGQARSLTLDLYDQWQCMENNHGKWRFTSPTHTVRAFYQALQELHDEGGIAARHQRYQTNQKTLVEGMRSLGFRTLLNDDLHSPIITSFYSPEHSDYQFKEFYNRLKAQGFVIYPGKVSNANCFRIGNIGDVYPDDIKRLITAVKTAIYWEQV